LKRKYKGVWILIGGMGNLFLVFLVAKSQYFSRTKELRKEIVWKEK